MARSFNGTSDFITIASGFDGATTPLSIHCWINPAQVTANAAMIGATGTGANNGGLEFRVGTTAKLEVLEMNVSFVAGSTGTVSANAWSGAGFSYDASKNYAFYINGSLSGSGTSTVTISTGAAPYFFGKQGVPSAEFFSGSIADLAVWNVILSAAEFSALGKGARPNTIRPASLRIYSPLTGLQSPEPDLSGHAYNGTLTGTANASGPPVMQFTPRWPRQALDTPPPVILLPGQFSTSFAQRVSAVGY